METKEQNLINEIKKQNKVAIAFSGGIDSVYLANKAVEILGKDNVLAVIVNSEFFTDEEFKKAEKTAQVLGINFATAYMHELEIPAIANNRANTWYSSKKELYSTIKLVAAKHGIETVYDGMIMDDFNDFRPGIKAKNEAGVISPLQLANYYKTDVRQMAKADGINIWNKIASCSLCSRFPYNTHITKSMLNQVIVGERYLRSIGFNPVRVRHHGDMVRLEVAAEKIPALLAQRTAITAEFKKLGFLYVAVDLEGYQGGKMNAELTKEEKVASYTV